MPSLATSPLPAARPPDPAERDPRVRFISFPMQECASVQRRREPIDLTQYRAELDALWNELGSRICCLVTEPYLGGGGSYHPQKEYLQLLQDFCRQHDIGYSEASMFGSYAEAVRHLHAVGGDDRVAGDLGDRLGDDVDVVSTERGVPLVGDQDPLATGAVLRGDLATQLGVLDPLRDVALALQLDRAHRLRELREGRDPRLEGGVDGGARGALDVEATARLTARAAADRGPGAASLLTFAILVATALRSRVPRLGEKKPVIPHIAVLGECQGVGTPAMTSVGAPAGMPGRAPGSRTSR